MSDDTARAWSAGFFAFVRNVAAFVTAAGIIWVAGQALFGPAVDRYFDDKMAPLVDRIALNSAAIAQDRKDRKADIAAQQSIRQTLASIAATQERMADTLGGAVNRLAELEAKKERDRTPVMRYAFSGHKIADGRPGEVIEVTWRILKFRDDCGRPKVELYFRNGGNRLHRFIDASAIDEDGRGIGLPANAEEVQQITYTVRIPGDDGVEPGRAFGWGRVTYPECPGVKAERSPDVPFLILGDH